MSHTLPPARAWRRLRPASLALACLLAAPLARADASLPLSGFGDFSGEERLLEFEHPELADGSPFPEDDGVRFGLADRASARFRNEFLPREVGPPGPGSVNNFSGLRWPFPADLQIRLPEVVHRIGFELRAHPLDEFELRLLDGGAVVDEMLVPSRGSDRFYFYGLENEAGFDELEIVVHANVSGAFSLDNLAFEALETTPVIACAGFGSPLETALGRSAKAAFLGSLADGVRLPHLRARLFDGEGRPLGADDLAAPPAPRVLYLPADGGAPQDVTREVVDEPSGGFVYGDAGEWSARLLRRNLERPGVYDVSLASGDEDEYRVDPTCVKWLVRPEPGARRGAGRSRK